MLAWALLPFSLLYFIAAFLRGILRKSEKISKPVICIGNLIAGGSGKTPTAIAVGKILREIAPQQDFEFAYLSKGYRGDGAKFVALRDGKYMAKNVGDEPMLLVKTAPTFVAKNRLFGAKQIDNIKEIKAIILDDGMQNNSLHKDFTILVVDGKIAFGNGFLLPSGPMREPLFCGLKKAGLVVVIGEISEELAKKLSGKKIVQAQLLIKNIENFRGKKLLAFCGLAYPQKFFDLLQKHNLEICETKSFPDHYAYSNKDLEKLCAVADKNFWQLIATKKDWVKFPKNFQDKISYLDVELEFLDKQLVADELKKIIKL